MSPKTCARLLHLVLGMPRLLLKVLQKSIVGRNIAKIFRHLALFAYALRLRLASWRAGPEGTTSRPSGSRGELGQVKKAEGGFFSFDTNSNANGYCPITDDNTISLNDEAVAFSAYPSSSTPGNRFSTSWTQLHFRPQTETRTEFSEARSTSTVIELSELSSRWESNVTSTLILSQAGTTAYLMHPRIKPVMPEGSRRYKRRSIREKNANETSKTAASTKHPLSFGWAQCTHAEGGVYFVNKEKRIYANADLYDTTVFQQALEDVSTIEGFLSTHNITLPRNSDLILDLSYNNALQEFDTVYYFVHHPSRSIFFLDNFEASWCDLKGINSSIHLREELEAQYWLYLQLFPQAMEMSTTLICELRDMVLHSIGDYMSSRNSATVYSLDELYKILTLVENLEKNVGRESNGAIGLLSQIMHTFAQSRVYNTDGEVQTRLKSETTTYGIQNIQRTWFLKTASTFLFSAPNFYFRTLRRMWIIGGAYSSVWDQGVTRLRHEWRELIFWSILLLIANAAFLGIHDIGLRHIDLRHRSGAQISSYISVVFNIGGIVLGLLFHRHIMGLSRDLIGDGNTDGARRAHSLVGLELRAILYSLPYVFLMWAVIALATAFSFLCFQDSTKVTRIVVGTVSAAVATIVIVCIALSWERYSEQDPVELHTPTPRLKTPEKLNISEV